MTFARLCPLAAEVSAPSIACVSVMGEEGHRLGGGSVCHV